MPYKHRKDKIANDKLNSDLRRLLFFRSINVEPLDLNDPWSSLFCDACGRETHRSCPNRFRHEKNCPYRDLTLKVLGLTEDDLVWSRKPRKHPVQLSLLKET